MQHATCNMQHATCTCTCTCACACACACAHDMHVHVHSVRLSCACACSGMCMCMYILACACACACTVACCAAMFPGPTPVAAVHHSCCMRAPCRSLCAIYLASTHFSSILCIAIRKSFARFSGRSSRSALVRYCTSDSKLYRALCTPWRVYAESGALGALDDEGAQVAPCVVPSLVSSNISYRSFVLSPSRPCSRFVRIMYGWLALRTVG